MKSKKEILERINTLTEKTQKNREEITTLYKYARQPQPEKTRQYWLDEIKHIENENRIYFQQINELKWILD